MEIYAVTCGRSLDDIHAYYLSKAKAIIAAKKLYEEKWENLHTAEFYQPDGSLKVLGQEQFYKATINNMLCIIHNDGYDVITTITVKKIDVIE